ncbi:hypothetical protein [Actinoplanes sp. NPDC049118]|uniref:hypothetical protein n=1 Tax=Actinoplanes sp. NPDC049118 TaxID=3155769 RepID=UPI003407A40A
MSNTATATATAIANRPAAQAAKIPTLYKLTDGRFVLVDVPFMIADVDGARLQSRRVLGGQGLGLQFRNYEHVGGWVADTRKLGRDAVDALAAYDVAVVDLSGKKSPAIESGAEVARQARPVRAGAARTGASPVTVTRGTPKAVPAVAKAPRKGVNSGAVTRNGLAAKITAALVGEDIEPEIIAEAIRAAVAKADERAKAATATVSAPAKAARGKAAPAKAPRGSAAAAAAVSPASDGSRAFTLAQGVPVADAATAARRALPRAGFSGVSIRKSGRTLTAYRADGAAVSADVDSVILAAVATIA